MKLVTSLNFSGQCREAMEFYAATLGGKIKTINTYAEAPPEFSVGPEYQDWLMHAWLDIGDQSIMGADLPPQFAPDPDQPKAGFDVAFHSHDLTETRRVFEALSQGGRIRMPFAATFWSPGYGDLVDRFGIPWMVNTLVEDG